MGNHSKKKILSRIWLLIAKIGSLINEDDISMRYLCKSYKHRELFNENKAEYIKEQIEYTSKTRGYIR